MYVSTYLMWFAKFSFRPFHFNSKTTAITHCILRPSIIHTHYDPLILTQANMASDSHIKDELSQSTPSFDRLLTT
jgi:hypothetical protein